MQFCFALRRRRALRPVRFQTFGDATENAAGRNIGALLDQDFRQHAVRRRGDFDRHLVGLDFDDRLVDAHGVAALLQPRL